MVEMSEESVIGPVFLSASVPDPRRNPLFFKTADIPAIREAVFALAMVVLPRGTLVFGSHPAITPLVLGIADDLGVRHNLHMFASRYFEDRFPPEYHKIESIKLTQAIGGDQQASLLHMREQMLQSTQYMAAVFIGGMEGVEAEFQLFRSIHANATCYPIASTGAAAALLLKNNRDQLGYGEPLQNTLRSETSYHSLFQKLLQPKNSAFLRS